MASCAPLARRFAALAAAYDEQVGADLSRLFNQLSGLAPRSKFLWRAFYGVDSLPRAQIEKDMQRFEDALARFLR